MHGEEKNKAPVTKQGLAWVEELLSGGGSSTKL
jgi:hypothetical protein